MINFCNLSCSTDRTFELTKQLFSIITALNENRLSKEASVLQLCLTKLQEGEAHFKQANDDTRTKIVSKALTRIRILISVEEDRIKSIITTAKPFISDPMKIDYLTQVKQAFNWVSSHQVSLYLNY